ncbi:unnamed protein product [Merluccius merluccius]
MRRFIKRRMWPGTEIPDGGGGRAKEERLRSGGEKGKEEKGDEEMEGVGMAARLNIKRKVERDRVREERIKGPRPDCKST